MHMLNNAPAFYRGRPFRTRLDATWSSFFDAVGWQYRYDPHGPLGWVFPFTLIGRRESVLAGTESAAVPSGKRKYLAQSTAKLEGIRQDLLILGLAPYGAKYWDAPAIGALAEFSLDSHTWGEAIPHSGGGFGFCSDTGLFRNRIAGFHSGDSGAGSGSDLVAAAWAAACREPASRPGGNSYVTSSGTVVVRQ